MVPKLGEVFQLRDLSNDLGKSHHHSVHPQGALGGQNEKMRGEPFVEVEITLLSLCRTSRDCARQDGEGQVSFLRDLMVKGVGGEPMAMQSDEDS